MNTNMTRARKVYGHFVNHSFPVDWPDDGVGMETHIGYTGVLVPSERKFAGLWANGEAVDVNVPDGELYRVCLAHAMGELH